LKGFQSLTFKHPFGKKPHLAFNHRDEGLTYNQKFFPPRLSPKPGSRDPGGKTIERPHFFPKGMGG